MKKEKLKKIDGFSLKDVNIQNLLHYFLRGGSQRVVDEVERSVHDAIMVVRDVMELPSIVAGGGAPETYAASKLRTWSKSLEGREQLAAEKFADA